jgi:hypothetical protein
MCTKALSMLLSFFETVKKDAVVKTSNSPIYVIPANAGILCFQIDIDSGFRRNDSPWKLLSKLLKNHSSPAPIEIQAYLLPSAEIHCYCA